MKVQNEMSTRISVETVSAIGSLSAFRNAIRATSNAWRAQETALKNSNNYQEAAAARLRGLNQVIDLQKAKVEELRQRQEGLDTSNKNQANQFLKLEKQISQANRQLVSYEAQAKRAREAARYQTSGLAALQHAYKQSQTASTAYVNRLTAEGRQASATVEKYRQLRSSLTNLQSQYQKQQILLRQVAEESGKDSDAYVKQRVQLDKTATSIAKTKTEMKSLSSEEAHLQPTGINRIDNAVVKLNDRAASLRSHMSSAFSSMKNSIASVGPSLVAVGATMAHGAQQAANLQNSYRQTQNLLVTGGEKVSEATRNVSKMQSDGSKMSVQYGISQQKIAAAYQELTKRGYTSAQSLGAMRTMLQASVASGDDLNDVVKSSTSAMEAFGLRANGTSKMLHNTKMAVNEMAYAADMTATDFKSMSTAMEYAGPAAKTLGYNVGQTASAIGILSNNGLEADKAGTGLRQVMNSLIKPTSNAKAALDKIGLSTKDFTDKSGKMKSMSDIFKELNDHTSNLSKQEKGAVFKALFGSTGESAGIILANNAKQLDGLNKKVEESYKGQGYVQQLAQKNMGSSKMAMSQFKEAANAVTITLGKALMPALRDAAVTMAKALNSKQGQADLKALAKVIGDTASAFVDFAKLVSKHTTTFKVIGGVMLAAFGGAKLLDAIGKTRRRFNDLRAVINKLPTKKHTEVTADTTKANSNVKEIQKNLDKVPKTKKTDVNVDTKNASRGVKDVNKELDKVPKSKNTKVNVDTKNATTGVKTTNQELNKIPKTKTSRVNVDTRQATTNIKKVGVASKTAAATSKISFASIKAAGVSSISAIGLAVRANPLGALITGIHLASIAFSALYKHSKTFRRFVNGLASAAKSGMKKVGHWFSSTFHSIEQSQQRSNRAQQKANQANLHAWEDHGKQHNKIAQRNQRELERQQQASRARQQRANQQFWHSLERGWNNYWRQHSRTESTNQRNLERQEQTSHNRRSRAIANFNRNLVRGSQNMWRQLQRNTNNGVRNTGRLWNNFTRTVDRYSKNIWNNMKRGSSTGWRQVGREAQRGSSQVGRWYNQLNRTTTKTIQNMARNHPRIFRGMYDQIQDRTRIWHDVITNHWSRVGSDTEKLANDTSQTNSNIFRDMYNDLNNKTDGGLGRMIDSWQKHMNQIGEAIESAKKSAGQAMADLANGVLKPFKVLVNDIQSGINWILDKVGGSKIGGSWSASIPTFATGTAGNRNGLQKATIGMVNDGTGSHWRELYSYKGHVGAFPAKRNFITYLPQGMSILDGENSHKLMSMMGLPRFANGIGDFFSGILDKSDEILDNVDKILAHPMEFVESVFNRFTSHISTGIKFAAALIKDVPPFIAKQMANWIKKQFATLANPGGSGVTRWIPYIKQAAKAMHVDLSAMDIKRILNTIQHESGGDPTVWQHGYVDVNTGVDPARGLLQFIGRTFRHYAMPGHTNRANGYDQLLALFNDSNWRGDLRWNGGWNPSGARRFANGGLISTHGFYEVAEQNRPEMIIPLDASRRGRAYQLLSEVMAQFKHEDGATESNRDNGSDKERFIAAQSKLDDLEQGINTMIQLLQVQIAVTKAQGKFDPRQQNIQQARALQLKMQQF